MNRFVQKRNVPVLIPAIVFILLIVPGGPAYARTETIRATKAKLIGFRLSEVDKNSLYAQAGLRAGDLVKTMNGKPVLKSEDLKALPDIVARDHKVEVKVVRNGKNVTLRYRRIKKK